MSKSFYQLGRKNSNQKEAKNNKPINGDIISMNQFNRLKQDIFVSNIYENSTKGYACILCIMNIFSNRACVYLL